MIKPSPVTHVHDVNPPHIIKNILTPELDEHLTHHGDKPYRFEASGPGPFKEIKLLILINYNYYPLFQPTTPQLGCTPSSLSTNQSWAALPGTVRGSPWTGHSRLSPKKQGNWVLEVHRYKYFPRNKSCFLYPYLTKLIMQSVRWNNHKLRCFLRCSTFWPTTTATRSFFSQS